MKALAGIVIACLFIYSMYWVAKNVSYFFFYEDLVQVTICEEVKRDFLINPDICD